MTGRSPSGFPVEFDVLGVSVGAAVVSGALSVVAPPLDALTGALTVLALAGWLVLLRRAPAPWRRTEIGRPALALAAVALGAVLFLGSPGVVPEYRGMVLGLSLVPLWAVGRRIPRESP